LGIANKELAFKIRRKENGVAELGIANKGTGVSKRPEENTGRMSSSCEKRIGPLPEPGNGKRKTRCGPELASANAELAFKSNEKEKRAAEWALKIMNGYQNEEKENRAAR